MTAHSVFIAKTNLNIEPQTIFTAVHFSQMKSLFTNKLLMTAPPGFFIHISLRIGRPRISTKFVFYTQIMIICCILERDKHEHKWRILHFKAQPFLLLFKEMS